MTPLNASRNIVAVSAARGMVELNAAWSVLSLAQALNGVDWNIVFLLVFRLQA